MKQPAPADVLALRMSIGKTQTQFGEMLHSSLRTVQQWEGGQRAMPLAVWELALIKAKREHNARTRTQSVV